MFEIDINGKGKEIYNNGKIKFEGEYFNGKRWKGKMNNYNGLEEFEILYGKGYGKEYNFEGNLMYEGNILNGERNGKGKEYDKGKLIFEGDYLNGEKSGEGKEYTYEYTKNKIGENEEILEHQLLLFEGEYLNGKRNGKGREFNRYKDVIFEGEYLQGKRNGKGKEYKNSQLIFEGEYAYSIKIRGKEYLIKERLNILKRAMEEHRMKKINLRQRKLLEAYINKIEKEKGIKKIYDELLIFEGEYLDGENKGRGKVFFNGILLWEDINYFY